MSDVAKLEYIWLDGYQPTQSLRSKTLIRKNFSGKLEDCPSWNFDGSSTEQAPGGSSDCLLKPVAIFPDPDRLGKGYLVMSEVLNPDGTPHRSNGRATINDDDDDFWFGFEQEYTIWDTDINKPIGFPVEIRYAPADEPWLSTAHGRDTVYLAFHVNARTDHFDYFRSVERVMRDHAGRPHWGKLHNRTARDLSALYPRWLDVLAVRDRVDPDRLFTNRYLDRVLGP